MKLILTLGVFLASLGVAVAVPNIVFIMSDDLGWADPGFNGGDGRLTPNVDKLATQGARFIQFRMTPVCATNRAALMSGRYPFRQWMDWRSEDISNPDYLALLGMKLAHLPYGTPTRRVMGLPTAERTLAEALKEAGYATAKVK